MPHWGHKHYITTSALARRELDKCKTVIEAEKRTASNGVGTSDFAKQDPSHGWKATLAARMAPMMNCAEASIPRRLWGVERGECNVVGAAWIEAAQLACDLPSQTTTLPGNHVLAKEMTEVYVDLHGKHWPPERQHQFYLDLVDFTKAVLGHDWPGPDEQLVIPDDIVLGVNNLEFLDQIKEVTAWPET